MTGPTSMPIYVDWYSCAQSFSGEFYGCVYSGTDVIGDDYWDMNGRFNSTRNCEWAGDIYCDQSLGSGPGGGSFGTDVSNETMRDNPYAGTLIPDCNNPQSAYERAFCTGVVPAATARSRIAAALADMDSIGGVCSSLAQLGRTLLANDELRVFANEDFRTFGGAAPENGANVDPTTNRWVVISNAFTNAFYDAAHATSPVKDKFAPRTLQQVLAHELDHLQGNSHLANDRSRTPNSQTCSRL